MSSSVITSLEQVTMDWLTIALRDSGALTNGSVVGFSVQGGSGAWSSNARLALRYSVDAQGECPAHLFLKLVDMDTGDGECFLPVEVTTYTHDYINVPDAPLLRCYAAAIDADMQRYHLLLDDVTATHTDARDLKPTRDYACALAEAFATLHARWWGADHLAQRNSAFHDANHIRRFVTIAQPGAANVSTQFGDVLPPHWLDLIDAIFANLPDLLVERAAETEHLTHIHCDPNPGNVLVPRTGVRPLYLIDSQPFDWSLTTWLGAYDVAYAVALYWPPDVRADLELPMLRHYYDQLRQRGVVGYDWNQLFDDYRLCVALCVTVAVEYVRGGHTRWHDFVRRLLHNSLSAVESLNCATLWIEGPP